MGVAGSRQLELCGNGVEPSFRRSGTGGEGPRQAWDLASREGPSCRRSKVGMELASCTGLRRGVKESRWTQSRMGMAKSTRTKLWIDVDGPMCARSSNKGADPTRDVPRVEGEGSDQESCLAEGMEPSSKRSRVGRRLSRQDVLLRDKGKPTCARSRADNVLPGLAMPRTDRLEEKHTELRKDSEEPGRRRSTVDAARLG